MSLLKAEVLITRRCNLSCSYCKIPKTIGTEKELTTQEWGRAFDIIYNALGADFIAIYGGEPLCLGKEKLTDIVSILSSYRPQKSYTIISNCIGLDNNYIDHLISAGLDSWTASVDTIYSQNDKCIDTKSNAGLSTLRRMKNKGLRDVCGIITVTKSNLHSVIDTVKYLNSYGIWSGIDLLHYRKCDGQLGLPEKSVLGGLILTRDDLPVLTKIADDLIQMKRNGDLVFPTYDVLEGWKNPNYSIDLNWKCGTIEPYCITIDADGTLMECDSFKGSRIASYNIFDIPLNYSQFCNDFMTDVATECTGCYWSTHVCAQSIKEKGLSRYYQHETKTEYCS